MSVLPQSPKIKVEGRNIMPHTTQNIDNKGISDTRKNRPYWAVIVLMATTIISLALGSVAFMQRNHAIQQASTAQAVSTLAIAQQKTAQANAQEAQAQTTISRSNELAAQSLALREKNFLVSMLLGIEAFQKADTFYSKGVLFDNARTNPQLQAYLSGHEKEVRSAAFSPDGTILATGGFDNTIFLWDVRTGRVIGQPLIGPQPNANQGSTSFITSLAFSPDGELLAAGSYDTTIALWNVKTEELIGAPWATHQFSISNVVFSPDGNLLASSACGIDHSCQKSGPEDETILWDVKTRQPIEKIKSSSSNVAFSPDGNILALGGDEKNTIILWDIKNHTIAKKIYTEQYVFKLMFFSDGNLASILMSDKYSMVLWDINIGQTINGDPFDIDSASFIFSPDGTTLIFAYRNAIGQMDMKTHQGSGYAQMLDTYTLDILALSPDGNTIAVTGQDKRTVMLLNKSQPYQPIGRLLVQRQPDIQFISYVTHLAFSSDGNFIISENQSGITLQWDVKSGLPTESITSQYEFKQSGLIAISPDGSIRALRNPTDDAITLSNENSGMQIQKLQKESIFWWGDMAFSPDGKLLVAKGNHADLVLWDIESEQSIGEPLAGQIFVFSPDGNTLAASNADQIILWDINPQSWIERTCQRAGRNFTRLEWAKYFPNEEYRATCPQWSLESELVKTP